MELDTMLVSIQSFLSSVAKQDKSFTHINHIGGNEEILSTISDNLKSLLHQLYINSEGKPNPAFEDQFRKVTFYLVLNTQYKGNATFQRLKEFSNLVGACPKLSPFVFANTAFNLGLAKWYSEAIHNLPPNISIELLEAVVPCVKKLPPEDVLEKSALLVFTAYMKLYTMDNAKSEESNCPEHITGLLKGTIELLQNFVNPETKYIVGWKKKKMYRYLGKAFICMFKLIANCMKLFFGLVKPLPSHDFYRSFIKDTVDVNSSVLRKGSRIEVALEQINCCLFSAAAANVETVTLDIFIHWAEVEYENNKSMQSSANAIAYEVSELVSNYKLAEQLTMMLKSMVFKPKSVEQEIREADAETLLKNARVAGENQCKWIRAFINSGCYTQSDAYLEEIVRLKEFFSVEDALCLLECISHDIITGKANFKDAFVICVQKFSSFDDIERISIGYLNACGFNVPDHNLIDWEAKVQQSFNKTEFFQNPETMNELAIYLLCNPLVFMEILLSECLKTLRHFARLKCIFEKFRRILEAEEYEVNLFRKAFVKFLSIRLPRNDEEVKCYSGLIEIAFSLDLITCDLVLSDCTCPLLNRYLEHNATISDLEFTLRIVNNVSNYFTVSEANLSVVCLFAHLLDCSRSAFLNFDSKKHEIAEICVKIITNFIEKAKDSKDFDAFAAKVPQSFDSFKKTTQFYYRNLWIPSLENSSFLKFVVPTLNLQDEEDLSRILVNFLPRCLPQEWICVVETLKESYKNDFLEILRVLVGVLTFLCFLCSKDELHTVEGMKYCLQQFGIIVKTQILPNLKSTEEEKRFAFHLLRLLKQIPTQLENSEAITLLSLFRKELLTELCNEGEFVRQMATVSHLNVCQVLARRMLEESDS